MGASTGLTRQGDGAPLRQAPNLRMQAAATLVCSVVGNLAALAATAWLIHHLGSEPFGRMALLSGAAGSLSSFAGSGFALYALRSLSIDSGPRAAAGLAAAQLGSQLLASVVSLSALAVTLIVPSDWSTAEVAMAAVILHCMTADAQYKSALAGRQEVLWLATGTLSGALALAIAQASGALLAGPRGYLGGMAVGTATQALVSWWVFRRTERGSSIVPMSQVLGLLSERPLLSFVVPATLSASLVPLAHWAANAVAAAKGSYADVAILSVALQFFNMVMFVPTVMNKIVLPRTIRADRIDGAARNRTLRHSSWMLCSLVAPLLVWALQAPITTVYRFDHPSSMAVLYCFTAAAAVACMLIPMSNRLVSQHRIWLTLVGNAAWAGCYVGVAWSLPGAALAAAQALLIAYIVNFALLAPMALRRD